MSVLAHLIGLDVIARTTKYGEVQGTVLRVTGTWQGHAVVNIAGDRPDGRRFRVDDMILYEREPEPVEVPRTFDDWCWPAWSNSDECDVSS